MRETDRILRAASASSNIVDRVVGYFSPRAGVERLHARVMLASASSDSGGYKAGRRRRRGTFFWRPAEGSADSDILPDLPDLRARSRDLLRNTPLATGAVATVVTNVVGDGLQLQASIDHEALGLTPAAADQWERDAEREFALFCERADFSGVQSFDEMQALAFRASLESGDSLIVRRFRKEDGDSYGTKLQIIEADRLSNPGRAADSDTVVGGVEVEKESGRPVAYHVSDKHPGGLRTASMVWARIPARTEHGMPVVLHLFDRLRPDQTRGVPYLAPVIEHLKQLGDYADAEVRAAVVSAMFTGFVETDADTGQTPVAGERDPALRDNELKIDAGMIVDLNSGEKVVIPQLNRPNVHFDPFVQAFCRQIGVALELPFELLIKHFTASYSASKAALEMAWQFFRRRRTWLARRLCQTVYEWVLEEAIASGRLAAPGFFADPRIRKAYCWANWIGPVRPSLNPKMEAEADKVDIEMGVKTREEVCIGRTGGEFEDKARQLEKEEKLLPVRASQASAAKPRASDGSPNDEPDDDTDTEDETRNSRRTA